MSWDGGAYELQTTPGTLKQLGLVPLSEYPGKDLLCALLSLVMHSGKTTTMRYKQRQQAVISQDPPTLITYNSVIKKNSTFKLTP